MQGRLQEAKKQTLRKGGHALKLSLQERVLFLFLALEMIYKSSAETTVKHYSLETVESHLVENTSLGKSVLSSSGHRVKEFNVRENCEVKHYFLICACEGGY